MTVPTELSQDEVLIQDLAHARGLTVQAYHESRKPLHQAILAFFATNASVADLENTFGRYNEICKKGELLPV